jgi:hypothetical protein
MSRLVLFLASIVAAAPVLAQEAQPSSPSSSGAAQSARGDAEEVDDVPQGELPVSLDRIREELARTPPESILRLRDLPPDFRMRIEERRFDTDLLEQLGVEPAPPAPPGGIYGYEQQRMLRNPTNHPLEQPYAAFSQGELVQVAATSVLSRLLTNYLTEGLTGATRARRERAAREEVRRAIAAYCSAQTEGAAVALCIATLRPD